MEKLDILLKREYEITLKNINQLLINKDINVTLPLGPLAFVPGQLKHDSRIILRIGDNWFAEYSLTGGKKMIERKLKDIENESGKDKVVEIIETEEESEKTLNCASLRLEESRKPSNCVLKEKIVVRENQAFDKEKFMHEIKQEYKAHKHRK